MKLRTFLTAAAATLGLLGLAAAIGLVWLTSLIDRATAELGQAAESIRAAEELEMSLLFHAREVDSDADGSVAKLAAIQRRRDDVFKWIARVEEHIGSAQERALVVRVQKEAQQYLSAEPSARAELLEKAIEAATTLSKLNITESRAARQRVERINAFANVFGMMSAALLLIGIAVVMTAARSQLYRPLIVLRKTIGAYRSGQRDQRVPERGPRELREIAAEFNDMATTLANQQEAQLRFIAGVAHDLKTPLSGLKMSATLLARNDALPAEDKARAQLERISSQADRLNRMVEDLLDRTRIESGSLELRQEECDLEALVAEVVELQRSTAERHVLELSPAEGPVRLRCDPNRMSQVITNLVNNAIKYSPGEGTVRVGLKGDDGHVAITVSDEGLGIPADDYERIFEPFRRSDSTKGEIPGIGLGLSISRRIVRAHGGEIHVDSSVGKGTTFRVVLPRQPPSGEGAPTT